MCISCRYELTSLMQAAEAGRCPECGRPWERGAPFVLRRKPALLRLFWTGSGPALIAMTSTVATCWISIMLGMRIVGVVAFAFGTLVAFLASLMGPAWVLARGRDERIDTTLRWWTPIAVALASLACNAAIVKIAVEFITRRLG